MAQPDILNISHLDYPGVDETEQEGDAGADAAALRQFTLHRLMAYGLEPGDGLRLLEFVAEGRSWRRTALALAAQLLGRLRYGEEDMSAVAAATLRHRASALQRISQTMVVDNTPEKRAVYADAAENFRAARVIDKRYEHLVIDTAGGPVAAWVIKPGRTGPSPVVLVHGGVDGWSMDWEGLALELVDEGMTAVVIDGPGQGETRFTHGHFLTTGWIDAYADICAYLQKLAGKQPIAAVGNSMAAGIVALAASRYPVFSAVCSNGPVLSMAALLGRRTYARKLAAFCGDAADDATVRAVFESMELTEASVTLECPYLLLQGSADPMVPVEHGERLLQWVRSADKQMVLFEGGEHVINRYPADKHHTIRTWLWNRMGRPT
ncbi:hypothetical protein GCM10023081_34530 [Arthrobacter ginkgonis]|uniref:AB hydrolase-1 domain-containing protein n=1 Tax=Arthrobacter ginkgonis TaxID=1630594 RepID=A0ABP7CT03_9MICC